MGMDLSKTDRDDQCWGEVPQRERDDSAGSGMTTRLSTLTLGTSNMGGERGRTRKTVRKNYVEEKGRQHAAESSGKKDKAGTHPARTIVCRKFR